MFDREARCLGVLRLPAAAANFTWGDDDLKSLYVTASAGLYRVRMKVAGTAAGGMTERSSALACRRR